MSRLDHEIRRLQKAMDHLTNERRRLEGLLNEYRSLTAPIRRIPPEMLSEIFLRCLVDGSDILNVGEAPLLLSFVCSRWRTVTISTPRLWSTIRVYNPWCTSTTVEMIKTWLLRSSNSPLTLAIDAEYIEDDASIRPCVDEIIPHCRRWKDVEFHFGASLFSTFNAVAGSLPLLQRLHIDTLDTVYPFLDTFKVAPMLRDVTFAYNTSPTSFHLPWQQLKQCNALHIPAKDCLYLVRRSPNLVYCRLECLPDENIFPDLAETPVLRTHLRTLKLIVEERVDLANILDSISSPSLDELEIEQASHPQVVWTQDHLSNFLTRSCCTIRCIRLYDIVMTSGELIVCLQGLPLLADLEVREVLQLMAVAYPITSEVLDRLTLGNLKSGKNLSVLVPKLKHLTLSAHFELDGQAVIDMVESRRGLTNLKSNDSVNENAQRAESLESVSLNFYREIGPDAIAQMTLWRDEGLELDVKVGGKCVVKS